MIRYGNADSSKFHNPHTGGSLDCYRILKLSNDQFNYSNKRSSSLHAEEDRAMHYMLKFGNEFDMQTRYAGVLEFASYVVAYYADASEDAASYAEEIEFSFQRST